MQINHKCPTCLGTGEIGVEFLHEGEDVWYKSRGDKELWDKYSHVSRKDKHGVWSKFLKIASFYAEEFDDKSVEYTVNTWEWSYPLINKQTLLEDFLFLDRKTGKEEKFKKPLGYSPRKRLTNNLN